MDCGDTMDIGYRISIAGFLEIQDTIGHNTKLTMDTWDIWDIIDLKSIHFLDESY